MSAKVIPITAELSDQTIAAILRRQLPDHSWSQVRRLVAARRVQVGGELCLDPARRLREGETLTLLAGSLPRPRQKEEIKIRYLDEHLVVVEKPSGLSTVRHPLERAWKEGRKALTPTLEDLLPRLIAGETGRSLKGSFPRLRVVQRLDKETSGLVVFARSVLGERELGQQFRKHTVVRRYFAVVMGSVAPQRIASHLVRDRGDGRRGSTSLPGVGKEAVTHVNVEEALGDHTLLSCRLETGRTHQIRIHLAEIGHPVCGDKVYRRKPDGTLESHVCAASRLALHAVELGFQHPVTGEPLHWTMPMPWDLQDFVDRLRDRSSKRSGVRATGSDGN